MECVAVALGQMQQTDQADLTLDECADRRLLLSADDQITLPVPRLGTVLGRERSLVNREHRRLLEPGPTTVSTLLGAAMIAPGAQRGAMLRPSGNGRIIGDPGC